MIHFTLMYSCYYHTCSLIKPIHLHTLIVAATQTLNIDTWSHTSTHLDLLLAPSSLPLILPSIPTHLHPSHPLISSDLLSHLLRPRKKHPKKKKPSPTSTSTLNPAPTGVPTPDDTPIDEFNLTTISTPYHDSYHSYENITEFLFELVKTFPETAKTFSLGKSAEGRDVWGLRIGRDVDTGGDGTVVESDGEGEGEWVKTREGRARVDAARARREFYLQGGQHAREVITTLLPTLPFPVGYVYD